MADKERQYLKSRGKVYFAKVNYMRPDQGYEGKAPNLQINLIPDNPEEFEAHGVDWREATDKIPGRHVRIATSFVDTPLRMQDAKRNTIPHDFIIGNGSVVNAQWSPYDYGKGVSAKLNGLQILELEEWIPDGPFDEEEEGFDFSAVGSNASSTDEQGEEANSGL